MSFGLGSWMRCGTTARPAKMNIEDFDECINRSRSETEICVV